MNINEVFDNLFKTFPCAQESKSMQRKPKSVLDWQQLSPSSYYAVGRRGGILTLNYTQSSNKVTIAYGSASRTGFKAALAANKKLRKS